MRTKIVPPLALGLCLAAPGASTALDHVTYDCRLVNVAQETVTGGQDTFTGVAVGYVASANAADAVSIRCYVTVDGSDVTWTQAETGTNGAAYVRQLTYTASDSQQVDLCAEWTAGPEAGYECWDTLLAQVPPQEVMNIVVTVAEMAWQRVAPVLDAVAGVTGCVPADGEITICEPPSVPPVKIDPR